MLDICDPINVFKQNNAVIAENSDLPTMETTIGSSNTRDWKLKKKIQT